MSKLQLNNGNTEALLTDPENSPNLPLSTIIGESEIQFSNSIRNIGVIFDDKLPMKQQVNQVCQSTYLELSRISSVRHVLTVQATKTLGTYLVLSRPDYYISLFSGMPQQFIEKLQKAQNCSAWLIFKTPKRTHASSLLTKLHWLPIAQRIEYKVSSMYVLWWSLRNCPALLVWPASPVHPIPSIAFLGWHPHFFWIPKRKKKFQGQITWNKLPYSVRYAATKSQFKNTPKKTLIKTTLFLSAHGPNS